MMGLTVNCGGRGFLAPNIGDLAFLVTRNTGNHGFQEPADNRLSEVLTNWTNKRIIHLTPKGKKGDDDEK